MSDESQLAYEQAKAAYKAARREAGVTGRDPDLVDAGPLKAAAQAHLGASRELETALAEYGALQAQESAGQPVDRGTYAALGQEVSTTRSAAANLAGNLPGAGHSAAAGIGD